MHLSSLEQDLTHMATLASAVMILSEGEKYLGKNDQGSPWAPWQSGVRANGAVFLQGVYILHNM